MLPTTLLKIKTGGKYTYAAAISLAESGGLK
jgi:hypothetical protein